MSPISDFNKSYFEFLKFIEKYLKEDKNFKSFYRKNQMMKETNPKFFIKTWNSRIGKYNEQIMRRDVSFFLNKDYGDDVSDTNTLGNANNTLLKYIDDFKQNYDSFSDDIKTEFINFIVDLTHRSHVYFN
jgi:tellurite resistance-related uncharacterized protein